MYKLYNGNCMEVLTKLEDSSIDLIVTDPPYLHVKGGMKSKKFNTGTWKGDSHMVSAMSEFNKEKIHDYLDLATTKMKKVNMFIFCSKLQLQHYFSYIENHKKLKYDLLVWDKVKYSMKSTKFYTSDLEYVVRIYEAGVSLRKVLTEDGTKSDINHYLKRQAYPQPRNKRHETEKPLELIQNYIRVASDEGDLVLDTFMGSGTTGEASILLKRNFIGIELEERHFKTATERLRSLEDLDVNKEADIIAQ